MHYWLMKTEPDTFGVDDLAAAPRATTAWDGVRNYQARNMLRDDMKRAGAWVFSGGLHDVSTATVVRVNDGEPLITDGPYAEGKEHLGGFTIIKAADLDGALDWGRKLATVLTPLAIEVRPFHDDATH